MIARARRTPSRTLAALTLVAAACAGCVHRQASPPAPDPMPRELQKVTHPEYVIEPPDILQIDALSVVPLPPYRIKPLDAILVVVPDALKEAPINAAYPVDPDGTIDLGPP